MNDERVISFVKRYPFLYDKRLKDFRNKERKELTWCNIALSLEYDVEDVKYRWKCLRERFVRESKIIKSLKTRDSESRTKFPYYSMMLFLRDTITHRVRAKRKKREENASEGIEDNTDQSFDYCLVANFSPDNASIDSPLVREAITQQQVMERMHTYDPDYELCDFDFDEESETSLNFLSDDEHFLLSLRMSFSAITDERKKNSLKIEILNLVNSYLE